MALKIHNTLSGKKEKFTSIEPHKVKMYQCGPTVYNVAHIGNMRTYITNDILRRTLEYDGYEVNQVMNITDVDDKMIRRSREEKTSLKELASKYEEIFLSDIDKLNILRPSSLPRATENIDEMIQLIEKLLEMGVAYKAGDGIYFDISKAKNYGQLANLKIENSSVSRIINDEYDKEDPRDFSLWKFRNEDDGDVFFDASFGDGRPGWHIECSAMAISALGETLDVHAGGQDLIFPHHTNEIAQSETATGKQFSHYWIHGGFVNMGNDKMSKSLGNIVTLRDIVESNFHPLAFRYLVLTLHYRTPMRFTWDALLASQTALFKLVDHFSKYSVNNTGKINDGYEKNFTEFLNDDLDTPQALALVWKLIKDDGVSDADKKATLLNFDKVFGFNLETLKKEFAKSDETIPEEIKSLAEERKKARETKDFKKSDELRKTIEERGYEIEDRDTVYTLKKRGYNHN